MGRSPSHRVPAGELSPSPNAAASAAGGGVGGGGGGVGPNNVVPRLGSTQFVEPPAQLLASSKSSFITSGLHAVVIPWDDETRMLALKVCPWEDHIRQKPKIIPPLSVKTLITTS